MTAHAAKEPTGASRATASGPVRAPFRARMTDQAPVPDMLPGRSRVPEKAGKTVAEPAENAGICLNSGRESREETTGKIL